MAEPPLSAHPAPVAGQTWNLERIMRSGVAFKTLIGTRRDGSLPGSLPPALRNLSLHYWHLQAGDEDDQTPHKEDELYYVLAGTGTLTVAGARRALTSGDLVFVPRGVPHTFHDFEGPQGLHLLIFFSPDYSG